MRQLRQDAAITQEALAAAIGCSKAQLSLMESGQRTVSLSRAKQIESALGIRDRRLVSELQWQHVPASIRAQVEQTQTQSKILAGKIRHALSGDNPLSELRRLVEHQDRCDDRTPRGAESRKPKAESREPIAPFRAIPVINKVAAGYPREFTDLDYPASIADEYITCPDMSDPDSFAARVVGDSMEPEYHEGDLVIFSPKLPTPHGCDCFIRLERDAQTTFKRIYFEDDGRTIRLQPLNNAYAPQVIAREDVSGLYAAAYVMRKLNADPNRTIPAAPPRKNDSPKKSAGQTR
jgi:phage repressor protein C with HTH and peptisase S24 domain/DNA-binding XRE family transcriptional regulator